jgi:monomeric sarcosine oxidase
MKRYDAIVLGVGGVGSAALYHLARRGVRALGIDRFTPPHGHGSTHGHTRVIRQAYFEHPDYVPLLRESYREWFDLERRLDRHLFHQVGLVEAGPPDGVVVPGVMRAASEHRLEVESLSADDITRRWPALHATGDMVGVFEPTAGYLLVEDCVQTHLDAARAAGAELLFDQQVTEWMAIGNEVRVRIAGGEEISARQLIISAGAWTESLLTKLGVTLEIRRKSLFWFGVDDASHDAASGMPVFLYEMPSGVFYGFPKIDSRGVKVAEHSGGQVIADPLTVSRDIDHSEQSRVAAFLADCLPGVSMQVTDHAVCLYTMSPDEHFILDSLPYEPNVSIAAGLSGHGYKFAPVLGRALADLALDGGTALPIDFLSLRRFTH